MSSIKNINKKKRAVGSDDLGDPSTASGFIRVEISPTGWPMALALMTRRMILPDLVLGTSLTKYTCSGIAIGPKVFLICWVISFLSSSDGWTPPLRMAKTIITSPLTSSGLPMTAASATCRMAHSRGFDLGVA